MSLTRKASISWWQPMVGPKAKEMVSEVIDNNFLNDGPKTTEFEQRIAAICKTPFAVAVTSGTAALYLALEAFGIKAGDEVIVPDLTFIATANAVSQTGATPVLVDVEPKTFNISVDAIKSAITPRTKAIMPVHVSGRPGDMDAILELAKKHNLRVIEDAAEGLGSHYKGRPLGSIGDAGCFSFSPMKTIATGQGGMIVVKDPAVHSRLRELKDQGRPVRGTGGADMHISLGYNYKFTDLQAAVGLSQVDDLPRRVESLRNTYKYYRKNLDGVRGIRVLDFDLQAGEAPQWVDAWVENRDALHDTLVANKIYPRKFWFPLHTQMPYQHIKGNFQHSIACSAHGLWLPSALDLTEVDLAAVCQAIRSSLG